MPLESDAKAKSWGRSSSELSLSTSAALNLSFLEEIYEVAGILTELL